MEPSTVLAFIGGSLLGRFTTTTLLIVGSLVVILWTYKEFVWKKVKP